MEKYKIGAAGFIIINNSILLTERKTEPFFGYWEVPAGKQEIGETLEQTVIREMKEETNLEVEILEKIGVNIDNEHKFESHLFLVKVIGGKLKNSEPNAHSKIEFVNINNMPEKLGSSTLKGLDLLSKKGYLILLNNFTDGLHLI